MERVLLYLVTLIAGLLVLKSCGEPYEGAEETVEEFMEEVMEGEGLDAVKYLHPSYREELLNKIKLPFQFTELRPSEILACILSSMGENVEKVKVREIKEVNEKTAKVLVSVYDNKEIEKFFNFLVVKEGKKWYIAKIEEYTPTVE